jgi:hypothetical protein
MRELSEVDEAVPDGAPELAISNLVSQSHFLVDTGRWGELTQSVFALEEDGLVPEADFGFEVWRGSEALRAGFDRAMPRFAAAAHVVSNMHISVEGPRGVARYYIQGWHWFAPDGDDAMGEAERNADFMVLGIMTDELVRQRGQWRVLKRSLERMGPGMAVGSGRPWLQGLGQGPSS